MCLCATTKLFGDVRVLYAGDLTVALIFCPKNRRIKNMHKCNNCGHEFEGNFCPNCGASADKVKICPNCGAQLADNAKFCNECGYSFSSGEPAKNGSESTTAGKIKSAFKKAWAWIKTHLKIVIPTTVILVVAIVLLSLIPTFILASKNGTYYSYNAYIDELDKESFIVLSTGKWKDDEGETGTYKVKGNVIIFYYSLGGEKVELFRGTLSNGVLKYGEEGMEEVFVSKKHKHGYGGWKAYTSLTCTQDETQIGKCACGKTEIKIVTAAQGHQGDWTVTQEPTCIEEGTKEIHCTVCDQDIKERIDTIEHDLHTGADETYHYQICSMCGQHFEEEAHDNTDGCTVCGYPIKFELNNDKNAYIVVGTYTTTVSDVVIPGKYNNLPVNRIGNNSFKDCSEMTSITIPDSVTYIGSNAFIGCNGLANITFDGDIASWCGISGLNYLMSSTRTLSVGGQEITGELVIPYGVTKINEYAFTYCNGLTSVTIPDSVTYIGEDSFYGCTKLIQTENGIRYVDKWAIDYSGVINELLFRPDTKGIAYRAFVNCHELTSVNIPDGVTSICYGAFENCSKLTSVTIPDRVTNIGDFVFDGCPIETATIPAIACRYIKNDNIKTVIITSGDSIGECAFEGCEGLTSVTIPDSVTHIGNFAFEGCSGITNEENGVLYVDKWVIGYNSETISGAVTLRSDARGIAEAAFYGCSELTSITISNGVKSISDHAFAYCSGLTSITIPDSVTSIGNFAFEGCGGFTNITIPDSVIVIGTSAFEGCSGLTNVTMGNGVTSIGSMAFWGCSELKNIKFNGTKAQWNSIEKNSDWNNDTGNYTVQCTDGKLNKNGK